MKKTPIVTMIFATAVLTGCTQNERETSRSDMPETENLQQFAKRIDDEMLAISNASEQAQWAYSTNINDETAAAASAAQENYLAFHSAAVKAAAAFENDDSSPAAARMLERLKLSTSQPAPDDAAKRRELSEVLTRMEGAYGEGKYCPDGDDSCKALTELSDVLANSRDYDALLEAWTGWRTISPQMRRDYQSFATLANEGAQELGYRDLGDFWKSKYDMPGADFDQEATRLWGQVKPLYDELHCYVRRELGEQYGTEKVPQDKPIPAHLLGNMWAQQWSNIYELVKPYPAVGAPDITRALVEQKYTPEKMVRTAEDFFVSLGLPKLPDSFYKRSMLTKPDDREVVCHASAWTLDAQDDVRIKMCINPTLDDFTTIYHELGHIYYFLAYNKQPRLFQDGAHDGFHEGIGDTVTLSLTPAFLANLGLADAGENSDEAVINAQMQLALDKIAFLPFGKMIDEWRWRVFSGEISPDNYNAGWWTLREKYQGIAAPVTRSEADFDPGAKYHIPANTPYTRYFLAHILQFQLQRAMCDAAGHSGPLHECSIYGNKDAGKVMETMLAAGSSTPWQETLKAATGSAAMDASAIIDYFAPLMGWLKEKNQGQACGW